MKQRTALFIRGGWDGHEPKQCVEVMAPLVESAGFDVEASDTLASLDDADRLAGFSVIVPCWTMGELTSERESSLLSAVRGGVGIAGWHGGMGDAFRANTDYQFMVGGQFVAHPGGLIDYRVEISDCDHPVTRGIDDFDVRGSEQYYMHVDPTNRVLATTTVSGRNVPWVAGCVMPVVWTRRWGNGRVFYCSVGHVASDLRIPEVGEVIRRGILWAGGVDDPARQAGG